MSSSKNSHKDSSDTEIDVSDAETQAAMAPVRKRAPKVRLTADRILKLDVAEVPRDAMCVALAIHDVLRRANASPKTFEELGREYGLFAKNPEMTRALHVFLNGDNPDRKAMDVKYRQHLAEFNASVAAYAPHRARKLVAKSRRPAKVDLKKVDLAVLREAAKQLRKDNK